MTSYPGHLNDDPALADLTEVLRLARTTEAYAQIFESIAADCGPDNLDALLAQSGVGLLPITMGAEVKAAPNRYLAQSSYPAIRVATSGSTGDPTVVYRAVEEFKQNAKGIASRWAEVLPAGPHRVASLLDHNRSAAGVLVEHVMYELSSVLARLLPYTASGPNWPQFASAMREFAPTVVVGTPGTLLDAEHALRALGVFEQIRATTTTLLTLGATNTPAMRRRLSRSWQARVLDGSFGGTEPGTIATGCRLGNLHTMTGRGVYEVIIDRGEIVPLAPGLCGELVVTPTMFTGFILLRYVTGDRIETLTCPCGLDGVALRVLGRTDDRVKVGGTWVGQAEIEHFVFVDPAVEDYQLVADLEDNLTCVEISVFPGIAKATAELAAEGIAADLDLPTILVDSVSPMARTAGAVKSWARTRVRREVRR